MKRIPLFPLGLVLLPKMALPLHIFEDRYKQMIAECLAEDRPFGILHFDGKTVASVGCTARVVQVLKKYEDGRMDIMTRGEDRFVVREWIEKKATVRRRSHFLKMTAIRPQTKSRPICWFRLKTCSETWTAMVCCRSLFLPIFPIRLRYPFTLPHWRVLPTTSGSGSSR